MDWVRAEGIRGMSDVLEMSTERPGTETGWTDGDVGNGRRQKSRIRWWPHSNLDTHYPRRKVPSN